MPAPIIPGPNNELLQDLYQRSMDLLQIMYNQIREV